MAWFRVRALGSFGTGVHSLVLIDGLMHRVRGGASLILLVGCSRSLREEVLMNVAGLVGFL